MAKWVVECPNDHIPLIVESDTEPTYDQCPICGNPNIKIVKLED